MDVFCNCLALKKKMNASRLKEFFSLIIFILSSNIVVADTEFVKTVAKVKPSVVGVGTYQKTRNPPYVLAGSGFVAASVPLAIPPAKQKSLTTSMIRALRNPYKLYQVDAVAYPGNSGSPLYDRTTGKVVALVSSGYVKGNKENALTAPTGITYAIPVKYVHELINFK